ncbi:MAG: hypothetical protein IPO88_11140 [Nannocystis sp.]|uniref:DUF6603 domain-containing protein n=1 Tax=Nannocystis sp. TaxID=1962667 RepID=UPI002421EC2A|nr:DUF6603 domain-containing protein [Nannocystis sp.]MBK9754042.1 hypothetical protein [Nannocystis sp.]
MKGRAVTAFSPQEMEVTARFSKDGARARLTLLELRPLAVTGLALPGVKQVNLVRAEFDPLRSRKDGALATLEGAIAGPGGMSAPVAMRLMPGGVWIVDMLAVAADLRGILAVIGGADEWREMLACLDTIAGKSPIVVKRCDVGIDTWRGEVEHVRVEVGGANNQPLVWKVAPAFELGLARVELTVQKPADEWLRRFEATIEASVRAGSATIKLELSNVRSTKNPGGFWRLAPPPANDKIKFTDIVALIGKDVVSQLPPWAREVGDRTFIVGLAMAFDMRRKTVASLEGGIELVDIAIPGVASAKAKIERIALSLAIADPFSPAPELRVGFSGTARIGDKTFRVEGASWRRGWQLAASCEDALSLTAGIAEIAGEKQPDLFGDFSLSLVRPSVLIGPDTLSLRCGVSVADGKDLSIGVGSLAFLPGEISLNRTSAGTRYELTAGLRLKLTGGPAVEKFVLRVTYDSAGREDPKVVLTSAIAFPVDGADPVRVDITGTYTGGKTKGFKFNGGCPKLPLGPLFKALAGSDLPASFPKDLALSGLLIAFNTADGSYLVTGTLATKSFQIGGTAITDSELTVTVKSEPATAEPAAAAKTSVAINGKATVGDISFRFDLHLANQETSVNATAVTQVRLGQFVNAFRPGEPLPASKDDVLLTGVGFRYSTKAATADRAVPTDALEFYADWSDGGTLDAFLASYPPSGSAAAPREKMGLLRPGRIASWLPSSELKWGDVERTALLRDTVKQEFPRGLAASATLSLGGTSVGKALRVTEDLVITIGAKGVDIQSTKPAVATGQGARLGSNTATNRASPETGEGGSKAPDRKPAGPGFHFENAGMAFESKPAPAITIFTDVTLNLGSRLSLSAKRLAATITPQGLSLAGLRDAKVAFDIDGAALSLDLRPWVKLDAAVMRDRSKADLVILGVGKLEILEKIGIGALVYLVWKGRTLNEGFAFVFATGLALGTPAFKVTGIAGGFGYNCVLELPDRPEDVPDFPIMALMRGPGASKDTGDGSEALMRSLVSFKGCLKSREGAWCLAFGLTFRIAELVDCALLVVAEVRNPGFELAIAGVADLPLRLNKKDPKAPALGHIQLALAARFSSTEGYLKVLGGLTDKSWLLDRGCRLRGGFAICVWFDGPHKGDFLVSMGGYSPLVPKKPHYPALDRVGYEWSPMPGMAIAGEMYFALDRYGIQLGSAARLSFDKGPLSVRAFYSFDALVQWSPIFFEVRLRIGIHVEVRTFITLRLGLDVDMHAWGPPFGALITVKVSFLFTSLSYTVDVGPSLAEARPAASIDDVLILARGGRPTLLQIGGATPRDAGSKAEVPQYRGDETRVLVAMAVPATRLFAGATEQATTCQRLDIRPMRKRGVRSDLWVEVTPVDAATVPPITAWRLVPEMTTPTEALWYYPGDSGDADERKLLGPSGRTAVTGLQIQPPDGRANTPITVTTEPEVEHFSLRAARAGLPAPSLAVTRGALVAAGFELGDCA